MLVSHLPIRMVCTAASVFYKSIFIRPLHFCSRCATEFNRLCLHSRLRLWRRLRRRTSLRLCSMIPGRRRCWRSAITWRCICRRSWGIAVSGIDISGIDRGLAGFSKDTGAVELILIFRRTNLVAGDLRRFYIS